MVGIIEDFNDIANKELQDAHLFGLIRPVEVKRRRPTVGSAPKTRRANYSYNVSDVSLLLSFSPLLVPSVLFPHFNSFFCPHLAKSYYFD